MSPEGKTRRKNPPKPRKAKERREDMKIIVSASEADIYTWAVSLVIMAIILISATILASIKG